MGKIVVLECNVISRQIRKRNRYHVQPTKKVFKRNSRFKENVIFNKRRLRGKRGTETKLNLF